MIEFVGKDICIFEDDFILFQVSLRAQLLRDSLQGSVQRLRQRDEPRVVRPRRVRQPRQKRIHLHLRTGE
jgi:hypothetical protein